MGLTTMVCYSNGTEIYTLYAEKNNPYKYYFGSIGMYKLMSIDVDK